MYQNNRNNENWKEEIKVEDGKRTILCYIAYVVPRYYTCGRNEIICTSYGPSCGFYVGGSDAEHTQSSVVNLVAHRRVGEVSQFVELE